jgi:hypothetical protein
VKKYLDGFEIMFKIDCMTLEMACLVKRLNWPKSVNEGRTPLNAEGRLRGRLVDEGYITVRKGLRCQL